MPTADEEPRTPTKRRLSFRKSLVDCSLPAGYLDALEQKRKSLDESIHKYIASKEREYKQFEKELRHQAKRAEGVDGGQHAQPSKHDSPLSAVDTLLRTDSRRKLHDSTAEADFGGAPSAQSSAEAKRREDFQGLFTPEYLAALEHSLPERTASEPPRGAAGEGKAPVHRTNSDTAAEVQRPRLPLTQRTSSSGSSIDGRLVSALKSATSVSKQKRVSLAVGDCVVAPSDNVPLSLSNNRTSSHSRPRSSSRGDRHAFLAGGRTPAPIIAPDATQEDSMSEVSAAIQTLKEQGSASAASATDRKRAQHAAAAPKEDVGDMFDLEEDELNAEFDGIPIDSSPEDRLDNEIIGRVSSISPEQDGFDALQEEQDLPQGEPPPADIDDPQVAAALIFAEGASASKQPLSPGFRRPSAILDPMYAARSSQTADSSLEDNSFYGSSFSRNSKGSFTSSSLGESYMARNAEKLMEMRLQQQDDGRPRNSRQSSQVLPVR